MRVTTFIEKLRLLFNRCPNCGKHFKSDEVKWDDVENAYILRCKRCKKAFIIDE